MKGYNAEDKDEGENQNDDGIDLETGRLIGVQPQHGAGAATGAGGASAAGARIGNLLLLIGGGPAADDGPRTAGD